MFVAAWPDEEEKSIVKFLSYFARALFYFQFFWKIQACRQGGGGSLMAKTPLSSDDNNGRNYKNYESSNPLMMDKQKLAQNCFVKIFSNFSGKKFRWKINFGKKHSFITIVTRFWYILSLNQLNISKKIAFCWYFHLHGKFFSEIGKNCNKTVFFFNISQQIGKKLIIQNDRVYFVTSRNIS